MMQTITALSDRKVIDNATPKDTIVPNADIAIPKGWEVADCTIDPENTFEQQNAVILKKKISLEFPFIANNVEEYISKTLDKFDIPISEAFIFINMDATFHILLLVNQVDYSSPKLYAAKIMAEEYLGLTKKVGPFLFKKRPDISFVLRTN